MTVARGVEQRLIEGLAHLGLDLAVAPFLHYLSLLNTWNRAYNLTAVRSEEDRVGRHVLDSLAVLPWLRGSTLLDVGTGAGLPGIPLALARPDLSVVLLDSNGKKTRFLHEVKRALSLHNVEVVQARVENYHPSHGFDTVVSRAFSELNQMITWTQHLVADHGIWLAMKGRHPDEELAVFDGRAQVHGYTVPGVEGERCCVIIERVPTHLGENHGESHSHC